MFAVGGGGKGMPASQLVNTAGGAGLTLAGVVLAQGSAPSAETTGYGIGIAGVIGVILANTVPAIREWSNRRWDNIEAERAARIADLIDRADAAEAKAEDAARRANQAERTIQQNTRRISGAETQAAVAEGRIRSIARKLAGAGEFAPESGDNLPVVRPRVLIVDDDPDTIEMMSEIIDLLGCEPIGAFGHAEAIKKLNLMPEWVLLDLGLADGDDGMVILRDIQQRCTQCRIVVITGLEERTQEALDAGAERVFIKGRYRTRDLEELFREKSP